MPDKPDPFHAFEALVHSMVSLPVASKDDTELKISFLERLIERWRINHHKLESAVTFEDFDTWDYRIEQGRIQFVEKRGDIPVAGTGLPPIRYQRTLLVYLLLHHQGGNCRIPVFNIIRDFIGAVHDRLSPVDFKKTDTGVIRCYTNTRFAANKLREYGLLKYTRNEAFKTWTLSLPGILVAAQALQCSDWKIPFIHNQGMFGLDPMILSASSSVKDFPTMVETLTAICAPDIQIFETYKEVLTVALELLQKYWHALENPELKQKERSKHSLECCQAIEAIPFFEMFVEELADSIQIDKLLKAANEAADKS